MLDVVGVMSKDWDEDLHPIVDIRTLINDIKSDCNIVVTGGEPLLWNMKPLTKLLKKNNFKTH